VSHFFSRELYILSETFLAVWKCTNFTLVIIIRLFITVLAIFDNNCEFYFICITLFRYVEGKRKDRFLYVGIVDRQNQNGAGNPPPPL
jgi:hypothetical protein